MENTGLSPLGGPLDVRPGGAYVIHTLAEESAMAIVEAAFESEQELQDWVYGKFDSFLPHCFLVPGFQVTTISGKKGVPDGFAFNYDAREWYVVECELLEHGVWPHIAEQITRFVVALQNPATLRKVRDKLFEHVMDEERAGDVAQALGTTSERLHQQLELFIETSQPQVAVFIDDVNRDLQDMAHALDTPTRIFRVQKFLVNGSAEYYSPDRHAPAVESEPSDEGTDSVYDVIELLGGGSLEATVHRFKCYKLSGGDVVHLKRSKFHEANQYYWYGVSTAALGYIRQYSVTHIVFVMGDFGFAKVPMSVVHEFLQHTRVSRNPDGSVRHYHCLISHGPEPELFWSNDQPKQPLTDYFQLFD